mgnify:CR=1 FL=1
MVGASDVQLESSITMRFFISVGLFIASFIFYIEIREWMRYKREERLRELHRGK